MLSPILYIICILNNTINDVHLCFVNFFSILLSNQCIFKGLKQTGREKSFKRIFPSQFVVSYLVSNQCIFKELKQKCNTLTVYSITTPQTHCA